MIQHEMRNDKGVLIVKPLGPLAAEDFAAITRDVRGYIDTHGALDGFMICAKKFPGYKNAQGLWSHLRFVRDHHRKIKKVAFVSDSRFYEVASRLVSRCVQPKVKHFGYKHEDSAMNWIGSF
jgi:SpoIIAA-like